MEKKSIINRKMAPRKTIIQGIKRTLTLRRMKQF
jgi:hypothetical protein